MKTMDKEQPGHGQQQPGQGQQQPPQSQPDKDKNKDRQGGSRNEPNR